MPLQQSNAKPYATATFLKSQQYFPLTGGENGKPGIRSSRYFCSPLLKRSIAACLSRLLTLPSMRSKGYLRNRKLSSSTSIMILNWLKINTCRSDAVGQEVGILLNAIYQGTFLCFCHLVHTSCSHIKQ